MLFNDDCLNILPTLADKSIDLICTDLPYAVTTCHWDSMIPLEPLWEQFRRIAKGNIILFGQGIFSAKLIISAPDLYKYTIIWDKCNASNFLNANRMPLISHEDIIVFSIGAHFYNPQMRLGEWKTNNPGVALKHTNKVTRLPSTYNNIYYPKSIWKYNRDHNTVHPTQKPIDLIAELVNTYSKDGDTVLDATMGSGTTGVVCQKLNRKFIGIEKDPEYFKIAQKRIEETQEYLF